MCMCLKVLMKTKRNKISKLMNLIFGGVPERLKGPVLKTGVLARVPGVRIPPPPPINGKLTREEIVIE